MDEKTREWLASGPSELDGLPGQDAEIARSVVGEERLARLERRVEELKGRLWMLVDEMRKRS